MGARAKRWFGGVCGVLGVLSVAIVATHRPVDETDFSATGTASPEYWSRDGILLRVRINSRGARCMWRPSNELSPNAASAFVQLEDARFGSHHGIDWRAVARAVRDLVLGGRRSGASTLSMQLARLLRPSPRTASGKIREMVYATRIESTLGKHEILEQYLNRVPLGRGIEGVEAAAWAYFGHSAATLSVTESVFLAALAPAPSRLDPRIHAAAACAAFQRAASRIGATDRICPTIRYTNWPVLAPHLVDLVPSELPRDGGRWLLSVDQATQWVTEQELSRHRQRLLLDGVQDAAAVVLDTRSGEVRALVGSFDYDEGRSGQVNGALARRQAGSILKPFLYGMYLAGPSAIDRQLADTPRCFRSDEDVFCPQNNDRLFRGMVPARVALASSLNVPALEVQERVGRARFAAKLAEARIASAAQLEHAGQGLALGDVDVRLLDVSRAFAALARGGRLARPPLASGLPSDPETALWSREGADAVIEALSDQSAREIGFGELGRLGLPRHVALKTGTSTYARDLWALAASSRWTVGIWLGNSNGEPTDSSAIEAAAPLAASLMQQLQEEEATLSTGRR